MAEFQIGSRKIGANHPAFIIAEAGINHDGKFEQAIELIDIAKDAGADAVKFQLFKANKMYHAKPGKYRTANGKEVSIFSLIKNMEMPAEWIHPLMEHCEKRMIEFISTVCDEGSADILESFGPNAYKIASYEINHIPLLKHVAKYQKPIIFSSAGAKLSEISEAYEAIVEQSNHKIAIMHCVAKYPAPLEYSNLNVIRMLKLAFPEAVIGFSDHSEDPVIAPTTAVALGATIVEKHFTIDKSLEGADHSFALNPKQLKQMVDAIRETEIEIEAGKEFQISEKVLGHSCKQTADIEKEIRNFAYRGIFTTQKIAKGESFHADNIAVLRPGQKEQGLHPRYYELLIQNQFKATRDIDNHIGITWADVLQK